MYLGLSWVFCLWRRRSGRNTRTPTRVTAQSAFEYAVREQRDSRGNAVRGPATDTLDTARLKPGKKFTAKLGEDLTAPDGSTIPFGTKIHGHVSSINRGLHGSILLSFDEIDTRHGWRPLAATVSDVPGEHGAKSTGEEGEVQKPGTSGRRMAEDAAVGAAVGATAGAIAAGPHGASSARPPEAFSEAHGLITDRDLRLNKGQQLEFRLDRPFQIPVE